MTKPITISTILFFSAGCRMLYLETATESNSESGILTQEGSSSDLQPETTLESSTTEISSGSISATISIDSLDTTTSTDHPVTSTETSPTGPENACTPTDANNGICEESPDCDIDCTIPECGDGIVNGQANEQCDEKGESPHCDIDCTLPECGDDIVNTQANEQCDEGGKNGTTICQACVRTGLRVFVTSISFSANLGGVAGADEKCNDLANAFDPSPNKVYKAWLSERIGDDDDNITKPSSSFTECPFPLPLFTTDYTQLAQSFSDLMDHGPLQHITMDESKNTIPPGIVWTRTHQDGEIVDYWFGQIGDCGDWTTPDKDTYTAVGLATDDGTSPQDWILENWTTRARVSCSATAHLYCFEQCPP
jgi:hypothetical protein